MKKIIFILTLLFYNQLNAQVCFNPPIWVANTSYSYSVTSADFNGDDNVDLATANQGLNNVSILLGAGTGSFGVATNFSVDSLPVSIISAYFNGDSNVDLAIANQGSDNVSILLGTGTGNFGAATNFSVDSLPVSIISADFNGDGFQDLAIANQGSNNVSILLGTGTGNFGTAINFPVAGTPVSIIANDFNNDGIIDLATANYYYQNVSVLLGTGTGSFGSAANFNVIGGNHEANSVIGADFNEDGNIDLAVGCHDPLNNDHVSILLGTGTGSFGICTLFPSKAFSIITANFNNYGKTDLAATGGEVSVLLNCLYPINSVWPGDADENLVVDNTDLFPIGIEYGRMGPARYVQGNTWQGDTCNIWSDTLINGKNIMFADCNGDGIIDLNDTLAINLNYSLNHLQKIQSPQNIKSSNRDIYLKFNKPFYYPGDTLIADVFIGDSTNVQTNFYGAAFNLYNYYGNWDAIAGSEQFFFNNSWIGNINQSMIKFSKVQEWHAVDASIVRITHTDTSGFGKIGTFKFVVIGGGGGPWLYFILSNAIKIDSVGNITPLISGTDSVTTIDTTTIYVNPLSINNNLIYIYPNPAANNITIKNSQQSDIEIRNIVGQILRTVKDAENETTIDIKDLFSGIYIVRVQINKEIVTKKFIKQ